MSARAIRKLREDRIALERAANDSESSDDDDEDDYTHVVTTAVKKTSTSAFAMMNDSSSEDENESENESNKNNNNDDDEDEENGEKNTTSYSLNEATDDAVPLHEEREEEEEEDLDDILNEFKVQDNHQQHNNTAIFSSNNNNNNDDEEEERIRQAISRFHTLLLGGMDVRDLNVDHVMRTSLLNAEPIPESSSQGNNNNNNNNNSQRRRNRQTFLFGNPRDMNSTTPNNIKPPHYVGGGIGMSTYDREEEEEGKSRRIPWPYAGLLDPDRSNGNEHEDEDEEELLLTVWQDRRRWCTFLYSDSYERNVQDFRRIQESGDMNALVLFVAHHPFVVEALITLGNMLYQVNQAQEGLTFLRRSLWVYESAAMSSFTARVFHNDSTENPNTHSYYLMDYYRPENKTYFQALFRLARVNNMAGLSRSSFAIGRYLLSMDPLRDPSGILLALDHYALDSNVVDRNDQWLVDFVESKNIGVYYRDNNEFNQSKPYFKCELLDLPNWAYSYALALFRLNDSRPNEKCNYALKNAIRRFPGIVDLLLSENDIDITSRSCRLDWQAVMDYTGSRANAIHGCSGTNDMDPVVRMATDKAYDLISRVFTKLNHELWSSDGTMLWLHSSLQELKKADNIDANNVQALAPAMMRYSRIDPADYETKFQLLPAEANPLDPTLVHHALVIDPNRRRFLRNQRGGGGRAAADWEDLLQFGEGGGGNVVRGALFGPPRNNIDLDWPMLEIFWRSLLPWNRIDEIPRPRP